MTTGAATSRPRLNDPLHKQRPAADLFVAPLVLALVCKGSRRGSEPILVLHVIAGSAETHLGEGAFRVKYRARMNPRQSVGRHDDGPKRVPLGEWKSASLLCSHSASLSTGCVVVRRPGRSHVPVRRLRRLRGLVEGAGHLQTSRPSTNEHEI